MQATAPLETIRLSQEDRDRLVTLKRRTGIPNWNTLCRWAFCRSIAEPTPPPNVPILADSNAEFSWQTFGGVYADLFLALLRWRCQRDGIPLDRSSLAHHFRLHLHRGIGYLSDKNVSDIGNLTRLARSRPDQ